MSELICPQHQTPWKTVPGGVSRKSGKPYSAFKTCVVDGCQERPPKIEAAAPQQANPAVLEELKLHTKLLTEISESLSALVINRKATMTNHTAPVSFAPPKQPLTQEETVALDDVPF